MTARNVTAVLLGALIVLSGQAFAEPEPEDVIKYRRAVMKAQGGYMGAMSQVVKGKVDYSAHLLEHALGLHALSKHVAELFPEGSDFGETNALDTVWEKPDEFKEAARKAEEATSNLVKAVETGNSDAIKSRFGDVGKSCKGCHKEFRKKKE